MVEIEKDPLATAPIGKLMLKYAIPSVIALVVNSLYNIVDQIFIGWGVGTLGNSATNVIFPLNMIVMALALLLGDGGAAYLSLKLGENEQAKAEKGVNNTFSWLIIEGIVFCILCALFLKPLAMIFGATSDNLSFNLWKDCSSWVSICYCGKWYVLYHTCRWNATTNNDCDDHRMSC